MLQSEELAISNPFLGETCMNAQNLSRYLKQQPFVPFRIHLDDGRTIDIRHPELMMLGKRTSVVGTPAADETIPVFEEWFNVSFLHIETVEPIHTETKA